MVDESGGGGDPTLKVSIDAKGAKKGADEATQSMEKLKKGAREVDKSVDKTNKNLDKSKGRFKQIASSIAIVQGPLDGVAARFSSFATLLGRVDPKLVGITVAFIALSAIVKKSTQAFIQYEKAILRINNAFTATGRAAEITVEQFDEFATQLGKDTLTSRQAVLDAGASLSSFSNIATQDFQKVLRLSQDLAATFGGDLRSNTQLLGRALQSPAEAFTILERRVGKFTQQEREFLKLTQEFNEIGAAQELIFLKLEKVRGNAAKEAEGLAGSLDTAGEAAVNFGIEFVEAFKIIDITDAVVRSFTFTVESLGETLKIFNEQGFVGIFENLGATMLGFANAIGLVDDELTAMTLTTIQNRQENRKRSEELERQRREIERQAKLEAQIAERQKKIDKIFEDLKGRKLLKTQTDELRESLEKLAGNKAKDLRLFGLDPLNSDLKELEFLINSNARAFDNLGESGKKLFDQITQDTKRLQLLQEQADITKPITDYVEASEFGFKKVNEIIVDGADELAQALVKPWEEGETAAIRAGNVISAILQDIALQLIRLQVTAPLAQSISGFLGGLFPSAAGNIFNNGKPIPSAKGNVFSNAKIIPHQQGDIIDKFAAFPLAGGNIGTVAEGNKPEAILPLRRDSSGNLGVISNGGGANVQNNINVVVDGSTANGDPTQIGIKVAEMIDIKLKQSMVGFLREQQRVGGLLNDGVVA